MRHLRVHAGGLPFTCSVCTKLFKNSSHLSEHIARHSEERPYICLTCGKAFKVKGDLRKHMKQHLDDYPYKCVVCIKSFYRSYQLSQHMKAHSGQTYQCTKCNKSYKHKTDLTVHMRVHAGEQCQGESKSVKHLSAPITKTQATVFDPIRQFKPLVVKHQTCLPIQSKPFEVKHQTCLVCGEKFIAGRDFESHLVTNFCGKVKLKCSICKMVFGDQKLLSEHLYTHFQDTQKTQKDTSIFQQSERDKSKGLPVETLPNHSILQQSKIAGETEVAISAWSQSKSSNLHFSENPFVINIKTEEEDDC